MAWKVNFWARLKDGDHALLMLKKLLTPVYSEGTKMNGGGSYPNLFCAHPPFQIDGNFGGTAGIAEMLIQSSDKGIVLLPALPSTWQKGEISGLKARGGFETQILWENNTLKTAKITSNAGKECRIKAIDGLNIYTSKGKKIKAKNSWWTFKTKKGENYFVK